MKRNLLEIATVPSSISPDVHGVSDASGVSRFFLHFTPLCILKFSKSDVPREVPRETPEGTLADIPNGNGIVKYILLRRILGRNCMKKSVRNCEEVQGKINKDFREKPRKIRW